MRTAQLLVLAVLGCGGSSEREPGVPMPRPKEVASKPAAPSGGLDLTVRAKDGPAAGVAAWSDEAANKAAPGAATLALAGATFTPSLVVLPPGSALAIHNQDRSPRRVELRALDAAPDAPALTTREIPPGGTAGLSLPVAGVGTLSCSPEPCEGHVVVAPVGGVTDADGKVTLDGLAPGPARVSTWGPRLGKVAHDLSVTQGTRTAAEVAIP